MSADFGQAAHREQERASAGRHNKRYGVVTSWDPDHHLAKVIYQPGEQESGWLPTQALSAGSGYGHMSGLTAGDQVEVTFQEGEFETGAITSRVHSVADAPPTLQSGEELIRTPFGSFIKLANDGSVVITDKAGSVIKADGNGSVSITQGSQTVVADKNHVHMRSGSNTIWADASGCYCSVAIQVKADPYD